MKRIEVDSDMDDPGNVMDENEEGENIREEEADRQNTLSYIKCKPSITKQLNNPGSRQEGSTLKASMALNSMSRGMESKNMIQSSITPSRGGIGGVTSFKGMN